jgi:hypothetical protein
MPGSCVACALVRAASRLVSMPVLGVAKWLLRPGILDTMSTK